MEVILRQDVDKLGSRGQMVKVAPGYARNFLLPNKIAVPATEANRKIVEMERQAHVRKEAKQKGEAEDLAKLVNGVNVTIMQKAGENDQLFGSVTSKESWKRWRRRTSRSTAARSRWRSRSNSSATSRYRYACTRT